MSATLCAVAIVAVWGAAALSIRHLFGPATCPMCKGPHELSRCPHALKRI